MQEEIFRLNQPLDVVHFDGDGKCGHSTLPVGSRVRIVRDSRIVPGCVEIICDGTLYDAFEQDLRARSQASCEAHG